MANGSPSTIFSVSNAPSPTVNPWSRADRLGSSPRSRPFTQTRTVTDPPFQTLALTPRVGPPVPGTASSSPVSDSGGRARHNAGIDKGTGMRRGMVVGTVAALLALGLAACTDQEPAAEPAAAAPATPATSSAAPSAAGGA